MNDNTKSPILFLKPVLKQMVWGGSRLHEDFGYETEADNIGECWGIAAHPNGDSSINCEIFHERFSNLTLSALWKKEPKLFGNYDTTQFPLLIKIIDAKSDLSIQVHPDDAYAAREENGSLGKMECWYIIDCPVDAVLVVGHNAKTKEQLEEMVQEGKWDELIRKVPIKKGDFIQIDPGTVHAITAGCLILETQQNSDITYRLYDYGRKADGKLRELHIKQSLDVIQVPAKPAEDSVTGTLDLPKNQMNQLISCQYYNVYKLVVSGGCSVPNHESFLNMSVLEGNGLVDGIYIRKGDHFIIPANYGEVRIEGELVIIASTAN